MKSEKYYAIHMFNTETKERQIQKVKAISVDEATSNRLNYESNWVWAGTESWENVKENVVRINKNFYQFK